MSHNDGGYGTARVSSAEVDRLAREERQDAALSFLLRKDLRDIAIMFGLVPERCANCGGLAVRMGYCDADDCRAVLRKAAKPLGDAPYRKARGDAR